ncbi:hypothetical protein ACFFRR_007805 [Megaselia abdita]
MKIELTMKTLTEIQSSPKIISFGNVLLDYSIQIDSVEDLERYGLVLGAKGEINSQVMKTIKTEMQSKFNTPGHSGGSALNSTRILNQLGCDAFFFGSVGKDETGEKLMSLLNKDGVQFRFQEHSDHPTGECVCFVLEEHTALYGYIGASSHFTVEYLDSVQERERIFNETHNQIIYIEAFFLPQREDVARKIVEQYSRDNCLLAFNINAPYLVEEYYDIVTFMISKAKLVFGNKQEFLALGAKKKLHTIQEIVQSILEEDDTKIVVVTNGSKTVELGYNNQLKLFNVPKVKDIVDTTGAGDSFVAGFLCSYIQNLPLEECVEGGMEVASKVVTRIGCNLP